MERGVARLDSAHVTPTVKLCMHSMHLVCRSKGFSGRHTIFEPDMNTEMGVFIHMNLKYSLDCTNNKYTWVHGFNSLGLGVFAEIPSLVFLALHRERKRCGQVGSSSYSQSEAIYSY